MSNSKSILICGGNLTARMSKAGEVSDGLVVQAKTIEDIRNLEKLISIGQSVTITNAQDLTPEAQMAILKTLEEPPKNVTIVLVAENKDQLLPTILSRCLITDLGDDQKIIIDPKELVQLQEILSWIGESDTKNGFQWAQNIKDRQEAMEIIDKLISLKPYPALRKLLKLKKYLKANTNVRLTLENLFIN